MPGGRSGGYESRVCPKTGRQLQASRAPQAPVLARPLGRPAGRGRRAGRRRFPREAGRGAGRRKPAAARLQHPAATAPTEPRRRRHRQQPLRRRRLQRRGPRAAASSEEARWREGRGAGGHVRQHAGPQQPGAATGPETAARRDEERAEAEGGRVEKLGGRGGSGGRGRDRPPLQTALGGGGGGAAAAQGAGAARRVRPSL